MWLALVFLMSLLGGIAGAQRPDTLRRDSIVARLPAVEVTGSILPAAGPAIGSGIPARVSIVAASELDAWRPRSLSGALAGEANVSIYDDLGSEHKTTLVTRGFTASAVVGLPQGVSVFLDGVPVNEPDAGQVNFDLLPLAHVERVEILSGTASLLGPNSLGGAINLLTRRGHELAEGEVEVAIGSYDAYSVGLSGGGAIASGWRYYAGAGLSTEGGWRQVTGARYQDAFANVERRGTTGGVSLQVHVTSGLAETAGSLPLSVYRVRPDSNLSAADFEDIDQGHLALSGYTRVGAGRASTVIWFRQSDAERFNVNQATDPDVRSFSNNRTAGAAADWRVARALGRGVAGFRIGVGGSANRSRVRIHAERVDPGLTTHVESPIAKLDVYGVADYALGPLTLSTGVRYDHVRVPFRNRLDSRRDTTSTFRQLSPRGGVSLALGPSLSFFASAGQSFRAPALIELACADPTEPCPLPFALGDDPPLDPVVATTLESGGRWALKSFQVSMSAFRTDVRNEILLFPYDETNEPSGSTIDGYFANLARTRRVGIELDARGQLGVLTLQATYAATRATFEVDGVEIFSIREEAGGENEIERGDRMPLIPDRTASLTAGLALPRNVTLRLSSRYTGERVLRGDEANEEPRLPGHWVADGNVSYPFGRWEIEVLCRNLLNGRHATFGTFNINRGGGDVLERFLTPGAPRTFMIALRRQFGGLQSSR